MRFTSKAPADGQAYEQAASWIAGNDVTCRCDRHFFSETKCPYLLLAGGQLDAGDAGLGVVRNHNSVIP